MKHLLFINGHLDTGGAEKALLDILTHTDYEKYEVDLLLMERFGDYADQLPPQVNIMLHSIEGTYGSFPRVILRCLQERDWFSIKMRFMFQGMKVFGQNWMRLANKVLTRGKHYDCVIGFRPGFCTQIAVFAADADRRITWWHHGEVNVETKSYLELVQYCDRVVSVSEPCRNMMVATFPSLENKLEAIPNMLDVSAVQQNAEVFDPYPDKNVPHIVSVGRLSPEKHFENAIFAARKLKDKGIAFQWHLVGNGSLRDTLYQKATALDVLDCFIFEGNQINPYPYMNHASLFVHPSYVESQGLAVLEAMALGVPCVVTKSCGPCEFIKDGVNGILTEQSPESLTEKVLEILKDKALYQRIKENTTCPEQFHPEQVMKQIEALIDGETHEDTV